MKKIGLIVCITLLTACSELQQVVNQLPQGGITNAQIAAGLKEALNNGVKNQVSTLAVEDGFFRNELVKILLPEELQKVDNALRNIGLGKLADEGLKVLNRAAEDAVGEAIPIFTDAITAMSFQDARNILLGDKRAATTYLEGATTQALFEKFEPIIQNSFQKVGADVIWENLIQRYNNLPFTKDVNPDLSNYVTNEALEGVFTMVAIEEEAIRNSIAKRTSELLRKVFALQD